LTPTSTTDSQLVPPVSEADPRSSALAPANGGPASLATRRGAREPTLSGWGRIPAPGTEVVSENLDGATRGAALCRGLGRSYGDSSLPAKAADRVVATPLANRILAFDPATGVMRAEAGLSLVDLNALVIPRGFFTPVTPGTKYVTLGGMVASDVHGKNHHREGCFGGHVRSLRMRLADDSVVACSPTELSDLFYGTVGGMGLLGHVLEVEFVLHRIPSEWIYQESERVPNIGAYLDALNRAAPAWPMTVGWIDCLRRGRGMGRGLLMAGRWATKEEAPHRPPREKPLRTLPVELPNWALNPVTASLFNTAYYWKHVRKEASAVISPETFFYPLDSILHWNRGYGSRGFTQYQCVIPRAAGAPAVREFMALLTKLGGASPLCVIKDCGPEGLGVLSFPLEGTSVAIDMAVSPDIQRIVDRLNEFVIAAKGRVYLSKDRFTRADHFRAMEPRLPRFFELREKYDPGRRLRSAQSVRLFGDRV
jgi:decaprenylphospho-beta-D-ribofuranose 2-oxidase